jgi:hypothetical protein
MSARKRRGKSLHETHQRLAEFGDLDLEHNRVAYLNALVLDRVIPGANAYGHRLEATLFQIDRGIVNKLVATAAKLTKAHCERAAVMLERVKRRA